MDLTATAVLTLALTGVKLLAKKLTPAGGETPLALQLADSLIGSIAGNRADAAAASWLGRMKQHWLRVDIDPNHDLLRAVALASRLASYRVGIEYGESAGLEALHWSDRYPMPGSVRSWLREPCPKYLRVLDDAGQHWLSTYMPGMLAELDRTAGSLWNPPDADSELSQVTAQLERLTGTDAEELLGRKLTAEALSEIRARWPAPPAAFTTAFEANWFALFRSAFQARLKDDQRVANIFFAGQLSALRSAPGGAALPDSALDEFRDWFLRIDSKLDEILRRLPMQPPAAQPPPYPPPNLPPLVEGALPPVVPLPPQHRLPYRSLQQRFIGRVNELWQVHRALAAKVAVISGTGGIGKSQLAAEYCHRFGRCYPGGVYWVEVESGRDEIVRQLAPFAGVRLEGVPADLQLEYLWRGLAGREPVLVVLNNLRETEPLLPYLPSAHEVAVLVTTRRRGLVAEGEVRLQLFDSAESLALLSSQHRQHTAEEAAPLIAALGGLPMALELARGYLDRQPSVTVAAMMERLQTGAASESWSTFSAKYHDQLPSGHGKDIVATFRLSWDLVESSDARDVLQAMAELAPEPLPLDVLRRIRWFAGEEGEAELQAAVDELVSLSLVDRVTVAGGREAVSAHRLVLGFVRQFARPEYQLVEQVSEAVAAEMSRIHDRDNVMEFARLLGPVQPHAAWLCRSDRTLPGVKHALSAALAQFEEHAGRYEPARRWAEMAVDLSQRHMRQQPAVVAGDRAALAWILNLLGEYQEAEVLARQVLQYRERGASPGDLWIASAQHHLGSIVSNLGRFEEARQLLKDALALVKANFAEGHPFVAAAQQQLGVILSNLGEHDGARQLVETALASFKVNYPEGHPSVAAAQHELGRVMSRLGRLEEARQLLKAALASHTACYAEEHPSVASTKYELGNVLSLLGRDEEARRLLAHALASNQAAYAEEHPSVAHLQTMLGAVLSNLGRYDEARQVLEVAMASYKRRFVWDTFFVADTQFALGFVLAYLGRYEEARQLLEDALASYKTCYAEGHPYIAVSEGRLGAVLIRLGETERGWQFLLAAEKRLAAEFGGEHHWVEGLRAEIEKLSRLNNETSTTASA